MSDFLGVYTVEIEGLTDQLIVSPPASNLEVVVPSPDAVDVTVQPGVSFNVAEVYVPGPQGAPGVQNVFVGTTPPENPQENWIWMDVS